MEGFLRAQWTRPHLLLNSFEHILVYMEIPQSNTYVIFEILYY